MGFFDFVTRPVRGLGRLARGKFKDAFKDFGAGLKGGAMFIPGIGPVSAAALGALGGLVEGGGVKGALSGGLAGFGGKYGLNKLLGGAAEGSTAAKLAKILKIPGATQALSAAGGGGGGAPDFSMDGMYPGNVSMEDMIIEGNRGEGGQQGILGRILGGLKSGADFLGGDSDTLQGILRAGGLLLKGKGVLDAERNRKAQQALSQKTLDFLTQYSQKADEIYKSKQGLRQSSMDALTKMLSQPGFASRQLGGM